MIYKIILIQTSFLQLYIYICKCQKSKINTYCALNYINLTEFNWIQPFFVHNQQCVRVTERPLFHQSLKPQAVHKAPHDGVAGYCTPGIWRQHLCLWGNIYITYSTHIRVLLSTFILPSRWSVCIIFATSLILILHAAPCSFQTPHDRALEIGTTYLMWNTQASSTFSTTGALDTFHRFLLAPFRLNKSHRKVDACNTLEMLR